MRPAGSEVMNIVTLQGIENCEAAMTDIFAYAENKEKLQTIIKK